jgi:outer membrane receptor protein involved in Fe transport
MKRKNTVKRISMQLLLGGGLILSTQVNAQDSTSVVTEEPASGLSFMDMIEFDDISDLSLEDLMNVQLKTGSFLELDFKSSPVSMTIITGGMLENSGARHLSEALEIYVPGFQYMYNKWNGIIWGMRGVTSDRNTKFIFLVNGQKMNHESRDGAMSELDLGLMSDIERIEVLRGPAGLVYGSGSIAGVVNIVTKKFQEDVFQVSTKLTTWDMATKGQQIEGTIHKNINDDAKITVNVGYRESEGAGTERSRIYSKGTWPYPGYYDTLIARTGLPTAGSAWSTPGNYKASVDFNYKDLRIYSRATHQVTNAGAMFPVDLWPEIAGNPDSTASSRFFNGEYHAYNDPFYSQIETWNTNRRQYILDNVTTQISYKKDIGENTLSLQAGMDNASNKIVREETKAYSATNNVERNQFQEEAFGENRYNLGAQYNIKSIDKLQAAFGYQFRLMHVGDDMSGNNSQSEKATHPIVSDITYLNHALFAEGLYDINEMFKVNFGARYDAHTRTISQGGIFSPKLALITKLSDKHIVKLIYQTSANNASVDNYEFNRNNFKDDGTASVGTEYRYENALQKPSAASPVLPPVSLDLLHELRPEKASSFELSSVHEFTKGLMFSPSVSYNTIKDLFVWNQAYFRVQNAGVYNTLNIDLELKYSSDKVSLGINHTIQNMVNTNTNATLEYTIPVFSGYDSSVVEGLTYYTPKIAQTAGGQDSMQTLNLYPIRPISKDGKNFTSLATHVTKFYVDYSPVEWLTLSTNARIFYGLAGRKSVNPEGYNDLGVTNNAMLKWNAGVMIKGGENFKVGIHVFDILGNKKHAINTLRWQQMYDLTSTDLFGLDYTSATLSIEYKF